MSKTRYRIYVNPEKTTFERVYYKLQKLKRLDLWGFDGNVSRLIMFEPTNNN